MRRGLPDWRGLGLVLALTGIIFVEWPLSDALRSYGVLAVSIIARTLLLIFSAVLIARQLWPRGHVPDRLPAP